MKLLIAGQDAGDRECLAAYLGLGAHFVVVGQTASLTDTLEAVAREKPDVLLLDGDLADTNALDAVGKIARLASAPPIVLLQVRVERNTEDRALRAGAAACVEKSEGVDRLIVTIRAAAS
jgi:DNA-binding NarL/FixJ family response regulator